MMFSTEFFVPSTLNTGIGFHNWVKGMFLSLAHFLSIKIMFAPLSSKASAEMKDFFLSGIFRFSRRSLYCSWYFLFFLFLQGFLLLFFCWFEKRNQAPDWSPGHAPDKLKMPLGMVKKWINYHRHLQSHQWLIVCIYSYQQTKCPVHSVHFSFSLVFWGFHVIKIHLHCVIWHASHCHKGIGIVPELLLRTTTVPPGCSSFLYGVCCTHFFLWPPPKKWQSGHSTLGFLQSLAQCPMPLRLKQLPPFPLWAALTSIALGSLCPEDL